MGEFRSRLEELVGGKVRELRFPSSAGFRPFQRFFCEEAVAHPAKANLFLLYFLIKRYTREGDVVADIMAGTGSTGIVASYLGRHSVMVELESKFADWIKKNVELLEKYGKKRGEIRVIQGDARRLSDLLGVKTDSIVTSPPYSNAISRQGGKEKVEKIGVSCKTAREYSGDPANIGNLPHGNPDAIITSPPYSTAQKGGSESEKQGEGAIRNIP
jgi:DNA modification methylase